MIRTGFLAPLLLALCIAIPQTAAAQSCADFAERQIALSEKQIDRNRFSGALRVMNVALENGCRTPDVQNQVADILEAWYEAARASGSTEEMQTVIETVSSQSGLTNEDRSELQGRIRSAIESQITDAFQQEDYRRTYSLCRTYSDYSSRTFSLNYACGQSALEVGALSAGISRYEALLADWSSDQSALTRQEAYQELKELYLITARFDRGFETAKRVAQRDGTPENLLASLTAVRGRYLEPIARVAQVFFDGNVAEAARSHVRREFSSVNFPEYVQGIYVMDGNGSPEYAFFGESAVTAPGPELLDRTAGDVSLLLSTGSADRAWLLSRVDGGYFVVQFNRETTPEENVILEGLVENVGDESQWEELYQHEFTSTYPATGSAVASLLGGSYVADESVSQYGSVFRTVNVLQYFCVQNGQGEIVDDYAFSRDQMQYDDGVWNRTSETPALFHHEVQMGSDAVREVVWPTYRNQDWAGVIRVGIAAGS
jgi:hypothetical protein